MKDKVFRNTQSITIRQYEDLQTLDLKTFPEIHDFAIQTQRTKKFGCHLYFYSPEFGRLASFPWWDNVEKDVVTWTQESIPAGSITNPYFDIDQGWHIAIFHKRHHVYILQGVEFNTNNITFLSRFRVPSQRYNDEWLRTIELLKQLT